MNIERYRKYGLDRIQGQIQQQRTILSKIDSYYSYFNIDLIKEAVDLAINARKYLDPYFDSIEIHINSKDKLISKVYALLQQKQFQSNSLYEFEIPKNKVTNRKIKYIPIEQYVLRFMVAIQLSKNHKINNNIFGGKDEIFSLIKGDVYKKTNEYFWNWQKEKISSGIYKWVVIADVKNYYQSININKLTTKIINILSDGNSPILNNFIKTLITDIDVSSWCDNFFQNIYFEKFDKILDNNKWAYGRLTDDIRIYTKNEEDAAIAYKIINEELENLGLKINPDKQFIKFNFKRITRLMALDEYVESSYDDYEAWEIIPYIDITKIEEIETENVLQIGCTSTYTYIRPIYNEIKMPKKVTLTELINDKSGFYIDKEDIYLIIQKIENNEILNYDIPLLEKLGDIVQFTYGNYNHYKRIIKVYLIALSRSSNETILYNYRQIRTYLEIDQLNLDEKCRLYKLYLLLYYLFLFKEDENRIISVIQFKCSQFEKLVTDIIFEGLRYSNQNSYFQVFIKYLFDFEIIPFTNERKIVYWKDIKYWTEKINHLIENDDRAGVVNMCDFLLEWFRESSEIYICKAKCLMTNYEKEESLICFNYAFKNLNESEKICYYFEYAYCLNGIGKKKEALRYYSIYLNSYESSAAYNNSALIYQDLKDFINSEINFKKAIYIDNTQDRYLINLMDLYVESYQYRKGMDEIKLIDLSNRNVELMKKKAIFYAGLNDKNAAIETIQEFCRKKGWKIGEVVEREINKVLEYLRA